MNDIDEVRWASRVNPSKIRRLYETDARGIVDEELVDEVGWALYSRCQSILAATEAHSGRVRCPRCRTIIEHHWDRDAVLECNTCAWKVAWLAYFKTYQKRHLVGGGAVPAFQTFVEEFERARTPRKRMLAIDKLIHEFHRDLRGNPYRAAGINLIYGKNAKEVVDFLDDLSYGDASVPEVRKAGMEGRGKRK